MAKTIDLILLLALISPPVVPQPPNSGNEGLCPEELRSVGLPAPPLGPMCQHLPHHHQDGPRRAAANADSWHVGTRLNSRHEHQLLWRSVVP